YKYALAFAHDAVDEARGVGDEGRHALDERGYLAEDLLGVEHRAAVALDDEVRVFDVALDARAQVVCVQGVGDAYAAPSGLVLVRGADASEGRADLLVPQTLLARVVERAVVRKYEVRARADLDALRRDLQALRGEAVCLREEGYGVYHHPVAEDAGLARMDDAGGDE